MTLTLLKQAQQCASLLHRVQAFGPVMGGVTEVDLKVAKRRILTTELTEVSMSPSGALVFGDKDEADTTAAHLDEVMGAILGKFKQKRKAGLLEAAKSARTERQTQQLKYLLDNAHAAGPSWSIMCVGDWYTLSPQNVGGVRFIGDSGSADARELFIAWQEITVALRNQSEHRVRMDLIKQIEQAF